MLVKPILDKNTLYDHQIRHIECYPGQLSQVFMNIIANGIDAIEGKGSIIITTLSPCNETADKTAIERYGPSCTDLLNENNIKLAYCGYKDYTQDNNQNKFAVIVTDNTKLKELCKLIASSFLKDLEESKTYTRENNQNINSTGFLDNTDYNRESFAEEFNNKYYQIKIECGYAEIQKNIIMNEKSLSNQNSSN